MTRYDPERDQRRSIRLKGYDYAQPGAYFVTICTQERLCLFGEIVDGKVILNDAGRIATKCWNDIPVHFPQVALDQFVVMPNHVHGILWIVKTIGAKDVSPDDGKHISPVGAKNLSPLRSQPAGTSKTIGFIIRGFKIGVTQWMRQERNVRDVWQRNYYEHVIRNETALNRIRQYIVENRHDGPRIWKIRNALGRFAGANVAAKNISPRRQAQTNRVGAKHFLPR